VYFVSIPVVIRLGEHDFASDKDDALTQDFGIETVEVYPLYTSGGAYHDLALIKLNSAVNLVRCWYSNNKKFMDMPKNFKTNQNTDYITNIYCYLEKSLYDFFCLHS